MNEIFSAALVVFLCALGIGLAFVISAAFGVLLYAAWLKWCKDD